MSLGAILAPLRRGAPRDHGPPPWARAEAEDADAGGCEEAKAELFELSGPPAHVELGRLGSKDKLNLNAKVIQRIRAPGSYAA